MKARILAIGATIAPRTTTVRSAPARRRRPLSSRSVRASSGGKAAASTAARNRGERKGQMTYAVSTTATANSAQKVRRARVVGARGPSGSRARSMDDRLTLSAMGKCYALSLLLHRERLEDRERRAGRILQYPESADVRDVLRRLDDLAAVRGGGPHGRVDVLDGNVGDPVRWLAVALGRRVTADHRVAGVDHLVGGVAHRERLYLPPQHLAVERLRLLGVLGDELEPDELSRKLLAIGHLWLLSGA